MHVETPVESTRTISRLLVGVLVIACIGSVFSMLPKKPTSPTRDQPVIDNVLMKTPVIMGNHKTSCNYVQESGFTFPYAVPSCTWLTTSSSESYECVDQNTVKKTVYNGIGCSSGSGTKVSEARIVNGQNGAIVDCSSRYTCSAASKIVQGQCPVGSIQLTSTKANENFVLGVCFGVFFGPKNTRYGCKRNALVTDIFEEAGCTSLYHRKIAPRCADTSSTAAQLYRCSYGAPLPPRFPRPNVLRKSCGSNNNPSTMLELNKCYAKSFNLPLMNRCDRRGYGRGVHVEVSFGGSDCSGAAVMETRIPTRRCVNGIRARCMGRSRPSQRVRGIPRTKAIVGTLYSSGACRGRGIRVLVKKNTEFVIGFKKVKFVCSSSGVEEQVNGATVHTFAIGSCIPVSPTQILGKSGTGTVLGTHLKIKKCP